MVVTLHTEKRSPRIYLNRIFEVHKQKGQLQIYNTLKDSSFMLVNLSVIAVLKYSKLIEKKNVFSNNLECCRNLQN